MKKMKKTKKYVLRFFMLMLAVLLVSLITCSRPVGKDAEPVKNEEVRVSREKPAKLKKMEIAKRRVPAAPSPHMLKEVGTGTDAGERADFNTEEYSRIYEGQTEDAIDN